MQYKHTTSIKTLPRTLLAFFIHFMKMYPAAFAFFMLSPIAIVLETTIMPYALKMVIDIISQHDGERSHIVQLISPALWLGGSAWFTLIVVMRCNQWWRSNIIPKYQANIRMATFDYLSQHSYLYFSNQFSGNLANKVNDLPRAMGVIQDILAWNCITTIAVLFMTLLLVSRINVYFGCVIGFWAILQIIISVFFAKRINHVSKVNAEHKSELSGKVVDILSNINVMKLFARRGFEIGYLSKFQTSEMRSNKNLYVNTNFFRLSMDLLSTLMLIAVIYLLVYFWKQDEITTGDFVFVFNTTFSVMFQLWWAGQMLADLFKEIGVAQQALEIITTPIAIKDKSDAVELKVTAGLIEYRKVHFHYKEGNKIFRDKSVKINPKEKVGLVGYSGSGKSTFVNLLLRFFEVNEGKILIDGQNINDVTQDSLRANISLIPQDATLFHRTLSENIRYGKLDASHEDVVQAAKLAYCHEFIENLDQGYDTLVGERGIKLSGGQRQRIAIARAILENAPILILDEATSQLDSLTEEKIQDALFRLMDNKTTIVIAHRLSTLLHMDRILVFDNGRIVEEGTHQALMDKGGLYKTMWDAQVGGFLPRKVDMGSDLEN